MTGRVLEVDPAARRITLSLKKLLREDKLPPFASWQVTPWRSLLKCPKHPSDVADYVLLDATETLVCAPKRIIFPCSIRVVGV